VEMPSLSKIRERYFLTVFAEREFASYISVRQTFGDPGDNLLLAWGQDGVALSRRPLRAICKRPIPPSATLSRNLRDSHGASERDPAGSGNRRLSTGDAAPLSSLQLGYGRDSGFSIYNREFALAAGSADIGRPVSG
jgi:hypothetical protein